MLKCSKRVSVRLLEKTVLLCKGCTKDAESLQRKTSAHSPLPLTWEGGRRSGMHAAVIHCSSGSKELMHFSVLTTLFCR